MPAGPGTGWRAAAFSSVKNPTRLTSTVQYPAAGPVLVNRAILISDLHLYHCYRYFLPEDCQRFVSDIPGRKRFTWSNRTHRILLPGQQAGHIVAAEQGGAAGGPRAGPGPGGGGEPDQTGGGQQCCRAGQSVDGGGRRAGETGRDTTLPPAW